MSLVSKGRETGPVSERCEVVKRRRLGHFWGLTLAAPQISHRAQPGQFINVAVTAPGTLLRRPFSVAGASPSGHVGGTIDIVIDTHGAGTTALAGLTPGTRVEVVGPLGRGFPLPQRPVSAMLVGGGYGAAPLYWLGDKLRAAGHRVGFVLGAADVDRIIEPIVAKRMATSSVFVTEDGSMGQLGRVTDVLADSLATTHAEVVYACGPNPMLAAVSDICEGLDIPCQVAVEEHMACGVGVCMTCVMPVRDRHGQTQNRRVCVDGPVFTSTRVDWAASRYVDPPSPPPEVAVPTIIPAVFDPDLDADLDADPDADPDDVPDDDVDPVVDDDSDLDGTADTQVYADADAWEVDRGQ